jgi:hypothetical protein
MNIGLDAIIEPLSEKTIPMSVVFSREVDMLESYIALEDAVKDLDYMTESHTNIKDIKCSIEAHGIDNSIISLFGDQLTDVNGFEARDGKAVCIALEGAVTDFVKKIWEAIKRVIEAIKNFFKKIFNWMKIKKQLIQNKFNKKFGKPSNEDMMKLLIKLDSDAKYKLDVDDISDLKIPIPGNNLIENDNTSVYVMSKSIMSVFKDITNGKFDVNDSNVNAILEDRDLKSSSTEYYNNSNIQSDKQFSWIRYIKDKSDILKLKTEIEKTIAFIENMLDNQKELDKLSNDKVFKILSESESEGRELVRVIKYISTYLTLKTTVASRMLNAYTLIIDAIKVDTE